MSKSKIRIGVVEDHPMIQRCLQNDLMLYAEFELEFVVSGFKALKEKLSEHNPQVLLLDYFLKNEPYTGKDIARYLLEKGCIMKLIIITDYYDEQLIPVFQSAGVHAYLPKSFTEYPKLGQVIHQVMANPGFLNWQPETQETDTPIMIENIKVGATKLKILKYLKLGLKQTEIAETMFLSIKTINKHVMELKEAFNASTTVALLQKLNHWL